MIVAMPYFTAPQLVASWHMIPNSGVHKDYGKTEQGKLELTKPFENDYLRNSAFR